MGQANGARTQFDASTPSYDYGFRYVNGSTNGPGTSGTTFYSWYIGTGSPYVGTGDGSNNYGAMFAVDRNVARPYLSVRYCEANAFGTWRKMAAGYADTAGFDGSTQLVSTRANSTATGGGQILLNGSSGNRIDISNVGFAAPTTGSRSVGTKICLWSDPSNVDYAIGIELDNIWFSVPTSTQGFNWYAGTTRIARLNAQVFFYI